jgi:hypothetical protein
LFHMRLRARGRCGSAASALASGAADAS